jgi:hypothetical protein
MFIFKFRRRNVPFFSQAIANNIVIVSHHEQVAVVESLRMFLEVLNAFQQAK